MGSGDPSGLQNRRELASLALVSSTLTRFRQQNQPLQPFWRKGVSLSANSCNNQSRGSHCVLFPQLKQLISISLSKSDSTLTATGCQTGRIVTLSSSQTPL